MTNILALDLGTKTGWAYQSHQGVVSASGTDDTKPGRLESAGIRWQKFRRLLQDCKGAMDSLDLVVFEGVHFAKTTHAAQLCGGYVAVLQQWCEHHGIEYRSVPVQTIKRHATGRGNAGKPDMVRAAVDLGYHPCDDNEADAIHLLRYALAEYGESTAT